MKYVIGVDLGGTKIHSALIDMNGNIIKEYKTLTQKDKPKEIIINKIKYSINKLKNKNTVAVGIGIPGVIDKLKNKIYPPNIKPLKGTNLFKELDEINLPIFLENDANCFLRAEMEYGVSNKYKNVVALTLGTGLGGAVALNNTIIESDHYSSCELGHMTIDKTGYLCNCGNHGCLEMYVSGTAIERRTRRHINIGDVKTQLDDKKLDTTKIYRSSIIKDKLGKKIMKDTGVYLGIGLTSIINIFNPDIIVLGGSVSKILPEIKAHTIKEIEKRIVNKKLKPKIVRSKIKHAGTVGAGLVAIKNYNQSLNTNEAKNDSKIKRTLSKIFK